MENQTIEEEFETVGDYINEVENDKIFKFDFKNEELVDKLEYEMDVRIRRVFWKDAHHVFALSEHEDFKIGSFATIEEAEEAAQNYFDSACEDYRLYKEEEEEKEEDANRISAAKEERQELEYELERQAVQRWYTLSDAGKASIDERVFEIGDRMRQLDKMINEDYSY